MLRICSWREFFVVLWGARSFRKKIWILISPAGLKWQALFPLVGSGGKHNFLLKEETCPRKAMLNANKPLHGWAQHSPRACGNIFAVVLCSPKVRLVLSGWEQMQRQDGGVCNKCHRLSVGPQLFLLSYSSPSWDLPAWKPLAHISTCLLWPAPPAALFLVGGKRSPRCGSAWWNQKW